MGDNALNGLLPGGSSSVFLFSTPQYDERWSEAELITGNLIGRIQPSGISEERRKAVIVYLERLIQRHFGCQVCTFGSVPLKTYLPDGDIDLTAFSWLPYLNDVWANELRNVLENEEHRKNAKFRVKEVQCIRAEVQIVKCLVDNIIVDISFNQLGGLCTLCFLEEVDRLIGKDHLFKRSIILIKAWCFYESRILGAHHGLISTYALETLVLYIFHVFHDSLRGPLEVLFRFMEFFSKFDWEHYCLSLWGPIHLSGLHDMAAEPPQKHGGRLLLSHAFLYACSQAYGILPVGQDNQGRMFSSKHMNVVDPLRINNNLGRSVSRGNFYRIRSAFAFGARKLEKVLCGPTEEIAMKLNDFFCNIEKHCSVHQPEAPDPGLDCLKVVVTDPYKDGEKHQASDSKLGESQVAAAVKNHTNFDVQASVAVTSSFSADTVRQFQETSGNGIQSSETIVHASNGDTFKAEGLSEGKVKTGTAWRGRIRSSETLTTASKSQLKGTYSINVTGESKQNLSLDCASVSLAMVELNSRGDVENAKDLASFQDKDCPLVLNNYLEKQISINNSNTGSCESWASSALGPLPSSKAPLRNQVIDQAQKCSSGLHGEMKCAKKETSGSGYNHPLQVCCCQCRENDVGSHSCDDHFPVPSTVKTSKMTAGFPPFFSQAGSVQSAAAQCFSSAANQNLDIANSTNLRLAAAPNLTVETTSYVLEHQNAQVYKEYHENSPQSSFRRTSLNETWCGSTNTLPYGKDAGSLLVPPGFSSILGGHSNTSTHVAYASRRNEIVGNLKNLEDCNIMIPFEARSGLMFEGEKPCLHRKNKTSKDNASSSGKRYHHHLHHHGHDLIKTATDVCADRASQESASRTEECSSFEVNDEVVKELKAGGCAKALANENVNDKFYQDQMSKGDFDSLHFKDSDWTKTCSVIYDTGNATTRGEKDLTKILPSESLAVNENQWRVETVAGSSGSTIASVNQEEISVANEIWCPLTEESTVDVYSSDMSERADCPELVHFAHFCPPPLPPLQTAHNISVCNMNSRSNVKAVMNQGSFFLRANQENCPHKTSNGKPVVLGVSETLKGSGGPVTSGLRGHAENAAAIMKGSQPRDLHADILRGDFPTYLHNLQVGYLFHTSHLYGPLLFTSALGYPSRQMQEKYSWKGPGRPTNRNINMLKPFFTNSPGCFPNPVLSGENPLNTFSLPNTMFREELPKCHQGTGTYLPNLMSGLHRDRQLVGSSRGSRGAKFPDRGGTNSFSSRYHGMPRGQAKHEGQRLSSKLNLHLEKNNMEKKLVEKTWETSHEENTLLRFSSSSLVDSSANVINTHDSTRKEAFIVGEQKSADNQPHGGNAVVTKLPVVIADRYANKMAFSTESIKFGSLVPLNMTLAQQGIIQNDAREDSEVLALENDLKLGALVKSGETNAVMVPSNDYQQSSVQCSYQLKDEDFPPLPYCSQPRRSTGFDDQKDLGNRRPLYQACLVSTSS